MSASEEPLAYHGNEPQQLSSAALPQGSQAPGGDWANMPALVLASIFGSLPVLDRLNAAQVCTSWHSASTHPSAWRRFDYGLSQPGITRSQEKSLYDDLRAKQELYLDVIQTYGSKFSVVHMVLFYPESYRLLSKLAEICRKVQVCILHVALTTSQLPENYRRIVSLFLSVNINMREARLKNVDFLTGTEHNIPLPLGPTHTRSLCKLSLVNSFRHTNLSSLMYLINVTELTLMPRQIRFAWLYHLARASLHTLNIVNMEGVLKYDFEALPEESWRQISEGQKLRVNCYFVDLHNCSTMLCPAVPLATLVTCEYLLVGQKPMHQLLSKYADTLTTFVYHESFPRPPLAVDDQVLGVVQSCPHLTTLAIADSLHSSTLLLMVQLSTNFREPLVREDRIRYQLYIPEGMSLDQQVRDYTEANFGPYRFVSAMSDVMQREWAPLPEEEYFSVLKARYISW